jgi:hypothetical protein
MSDLPQTAEVATAGIAVQLVKGVQVCATLDSNNNGSSWKFVRV